MYVCPSWLNSWKANHSQTGEQDLGVFLCGSHCGVPQLQDAALDQKNPTSRENNCTCIYKQSFMFHFSVGHIDSLCQRWRDCSRSINLHTCTSSRCTCTVKCCEAYAGILRPSTHARSSQNSELSIIFAFWPGPSQLDR